MRPDVVGPMVIAGAPLSYWAGVRGKNAMRYMGGWYGGTWLDRMMSDIGNGNFDAAWLVANFDNLNPANTLWTKQYNVWSVPRFRRLAYSVRHGDRWLVAGGLVRHGPVRTGPRADAIPSSRFR
jgi:hypothetical protein